MLSIKRLIIIGIVSLFLPLLSFSEEKEKTTTNISGLLGVNYGYFFISFPKIAPYAEEIGQDYGFEDVYDSKKGGSSGLFAGVGLSDIGLFAIFKYRDWEKEGHPVIIGNASFDGTTKWSQYFLYFGARFYIIQNQKSRGILPYLGAGLIHSKATEKARGRAETELFDFYIDYEEKVSGTGLYFEGGCDLCSDPHFGAGLILEYSFLKMGYTDNSSSSEIDGGGGLYIGFSLSINFGHTML